MQPLTVMTYNVHGCIGSDRRFNPERIAALIAVEAPGVVAVQEFYDKTHDNRWLIDWFATRLGMQAVKGDVCERSGCRYGNALFTSLPIQKFTRHDLAVISREPRGALEVVCDWQGISLRLIATHFGLNHIERGTQTRRLAALIDSQIDMPTILLGDFNELRAKGPVIRSLAASIDPVPPVRTFPSRLPMFPLDRCFLRGLRAMTNYASPCRDARIASDHLPLVVKACLA